MLNHSVYSKTSWDTALLDTDLDGTLFWFRSKNFRIHCFTLFFIAHSTEIMTYRHTPILSVVLVVEESNDQRMFTLENPNRIPRANFNSNPKIPRGEAPRDFGLELKLARGMRFGFSKVNILWSLDIHSY